jgi:hypothetical protein
MNRLVIAGILAGLAFLTGCVSSAQDMTVHGTVRVVDNEPIDPLPVNFGDQVTVTDPSGKVLGVGHLGDSDDQGPTGTLTFGFTVKLPEGEKYYGVHVDGLTGTTQFTQKQMQQRPAICAGDACSG